MLDFQKFVVTFKLDLFRFRGFEVFRANILCFKLIVLASSHLVAKDKFF